MTNKNFINYLKTVVDDKDVTFTNSFIDYDKEKTICVYAKSNQAAPKHDAYSILPLTIIIIYTKNADKAQTFTQEIFNRLFHQKPQEIDGINFFIDIKQLPILLGKTDAGFFEYAIEATIYHGKENN